MKITKAKTNDEIDQEIAEKIFGWDQIEGGEWRMEKVSLGTAQGVLPKFCCDQDAANTVVAKINERHDTLNVKFYELYPHLDLKELVPGEPIGTFQIIPLEICLAALEAYEYAKAKGLSRR